MRDDAVILDELLSRRSGFFTASADSGESAPGASTLLRKDLAAHLPQPHHAVCGHPLRLLRLENAPHALTVGRLP